MCVYLCVCQCVCGHIGARAHIINNKDETCWTFQVLLDSLSSVPSCLLCSLNSATRGRKRSLDHDFVH